VNTPKGSVIGRVPQVSRRVERFLDTESIVLQQVPTLVFFRYQPPFADRNDEFLVIQLMAVVPEKLKEELSQGLFVFPSISDQRVQIIVERAQ
jgi:hypothetical protein